MSRWAHIFLTDVAGSHLIRNYLAGVVRGSCKPTLQGGLRSQTAVIFADVDRPVLVPVERRAQRDSNL